MAGTQDILDEYLISVTTLSNDMTDHFQIQMRNLTETLDEILEKLKKPPGMDSPVVSKTPFRKRKLLVISEESDEGIKNKKARSSSVALVINGESCSTPKSNDSFESLNAETENTQQEEGRSKRKASKLAAIKTASLLNEKLNHKKRRPSKNETDSILLDNSNLRTSTRQRNKKLQNSISVEKMDVDDEDKENSVIGIKGKDVNKSLKTTSTRITRNTKSSLLNVTNEENKNPPDSTNQKVDLMPPPLMPPKRGRKKVLKTRSARSKNKKLVEETEESEDETAVQNKQNTNDQSAIECEPNQSARSTRARNKRNTVQNESVINKTKENDDENLNDTNKSTYNTRGRRKKDPVLDESCNKSTRSTRNKAKAKDAENVDSSPKLSSQSVDIDESGNESNKSEAPRRTARKNKATNNQVVSSTVEQPEVEATKENKKSNDSGIESIDKNEENEKVEEADCQEPPTSKTIVSTTPKLSVGSTKNAARGTFVITKSSSLSEMTTLPINEEQIVIPEKQVLNETIVISSSNLENHKVLNETIVLTKSAEKPANLTYITKANLTEEDHNSSILTDDLSDIEDTPPQKPTKVANLLGNYTQKLKQYFSPVKDKVQHFERLAEVKNVEEIGETKRVTRTKTRAMAVKSTEEESDNSSTPTQGKIDPKPVTPATVKKNASNIPISHAQIVKPVLPVGKKPQLNLNLLKSPGPFNTGPAARPAQVFTKQVDDAAKKKEALLHAKAEEQKRKREEKSKAAAIARDKQEKTKQSQLEKLEKEKIEKSKALQLEREEKLKEEMERKRIAYEKKIAETEERRRKEEAARLARLLEQEEETKKQQALRQKQQEEHEKFRKKQLAEERELAAARKLQEKKNEAAANKLLGVKKTSSLEKNVPVYKTFDELLSGDESEDEKGNGVRPIPLWSQKQNRKKHVYVQSYMKDSTVDKLYSSKIFNPDLQEIFPTTSNKKVTRTSSIIWRTPPRFSMMPDNFNMSDDD